MADSDTERGQTPVGPVESPCIDVCRLDDDDVCIGCFRNIDEICRWREAGDGERREILLRATARGAAVRRA